MKHWVVCYDVGTKREKARRKLVRLLEGYGARVQFSVFEVALTDADFAKLITKVKSILNLSLDRFAMYPLTPTAQGTSLYLGQTGPYVLEPAVVL